jgi:hypothetical protein
MLCIENGKQALNMLRNSMMKWVRNGYLLIGMNRVPIQSSAEILPSSSSSSPSSPTEPRFRQVDSLPLSEPKAGIARQSFKDSGEGPFVLTFGITLTYQGVETWRVVSDTCR